MAFCDLFVVLVLRETHKCDAMLAINHKASLGLPRGGGKRRHVTSLLPFVWDHIIKNKYLVSAHAVTTFVTRGNKDMENKVYHSSKASVHFNAGGDRPHTIPARDVKPPLSLPYDHDPTPPLTFLLIFFFF